MSRALFCMLLLSVAGPAQHPDLDIEIERKGRASLVTLTAWQVPVRDILVHLGVELGVRHRFLPGTPEILGGRQVDVNVERMLAPDVVSHLAGAVGLEGHLTAEELTVRPQPAPETDEARQWAREKAVSSRTLASLGGDPEHLWWLGLMHLGGEAWTDALVHLDRFATVAAEDARQPRALLLAAWCALQIGDEVAGESLINRLMDRHTGTQEVMEAWLLKVRLHLRRKEWNRIPPLLSRLQSSAEDGRLRALAVLLEAEFWYAQGKGKEAEVALAAFDVDLSRDYPNLAERVPLYEALCMTLSEQHERALDRLQICLLTEDAELRVRSALAAARTCLHLQKRVAALQNLQIALNENPRGQDRIAARLLEAEVYSQLGLGARALRAYEDAAEERAAAGLDKVDLQILKETAGIFYRRRGFMEAREIYAHFVHRKELSSWAWLEVARCEIGMKRYREAISALDRIPAGAPGVDANEVAHLRGDCFMKLGDFDKAAFAFGTTKAGSSKSKAGGQKTPEEKR